MSVPLKTPAIPPPQNDILRLKEQRPATLEAEKARLRKATTEFESLFTYYMLKAMRQTVPDNALTEGVPFSKSMGKDTFTQLFDMEVSRHLASGTPGSIGDMLYESFEKTVEARFKSHAVSSDAPPADHAARSASALENETFRLLPKDTDRPIAPAEVRKNFSGMRGPRAEDAVWLRFGDIIEEVSKETSLDSALIASVIRAESNGDPTAVSKAGAKGLMQLTDPTARDLGVNDVFDPSENIRAGSRYLKMLLDRYRELKLALAAYNAGPRNVDKYGGIPPFRETQQYVERVTRMFKQASVMIRE
jgi:Rod binding domain-containing protein